MTKTIATTLTADDLIAEILNALDASPAASAIAKMRHSRTAFQADTFCEACGKALKSTRNATKVVHAEGFVWLGARCARHVKGLGA